MFKLISILISQHQVDSVEEALLPLQDKLQDKLLLLRDQLNKLPLLPLQLNPPVECSLDSVVWS